MSKADEPAFPINGSVGSSDGDFNPGLTKREYFAAMALQGLSVQAIAGHHNTPEPRNVKEKAEHAVMLADALLAELSKEKMGEK